MIPLFVSDSVFLNSGVFAPLRETFTPFSQMPAKVYHHQAPEL